MSPCIDAGWILEVQATNVPADPALTPPLGAMAQLVGDIRDSKPGLAAIARRLRDWKA